MVGLLEGRIAIVTDGSIIIVTGAGGGIGRAICLGFAKEDATIAGVGIRDVNVQETISLLGHGQKHAAFKADLTKSSEVDRLMMEVVKSMGQTPHILVNCAGIATNSSLLDMTEDVFDRMMATNFKSVFLMTQQAAKLMIAASIKDGCIVNISSVAARKPFLSLSHYGAAKAAMSSLTKSTALELVGYGIRCNEVCPGLVATPMLAHAAKEVIEAVPMKRLADPKEVADACVFLASNKSSFATGTSILLDGGTLLT